MGADRLPMKNVQSVDRRIVIFFWTSLCIDSANIGTNKVSTVNETVSLSTQELGLRLNVQEFWKSPTKTLKEPAFCWLKWKGPVAIRLLADFCDMTLYSVFPIYGL